ncbi:MAG TPA: hypothetical protein VLM79_32260, partial [Kofleriaceae bacterium]|nr:hypothetical protein [Kofleriaceae bacterium]
MIAKLASVGSPSLSLGIGKRQPALQQPAAADEALQAQRLCHRKGGNQGPKAAGVGEDLEDQAAEEALRRRPANVALDLGPCRLDEP